MLHRWELGEYENRFCQLNADGGGFFILYTRAAIV
jgi:hypothetical protein